MSAKPEPVVVIIHETVAQSALRDLASFSVLTVCIVIGVLLGSQAMQWIVGLLWVVWFLLRCASWFSESYKHLTPQEAAEELHRRFGVRA